MKQCTQCNFENIRNRFYCEQCGTVLPSSTPQQVKTSTPRSPHYTPPISHIAPSQPSPVPTTAFFSPEPSIHPPISSTQQTLYLTARAILYLLGSLIAAFGLFTLLAAFTNAAFLASLALFVVSIVLLLITLGFQRSPFLKWRQRLLGEIVAIAGAFLLVVMGAIIVGIQPVGSIDKIANIVYGSIILTYGIAVATVALW